MTWITNSKSIADKLRPLKVVERWPKKMHSILQVHAIVNGLKTQMEIDGEIDEHLSAVGAGPMPHERIDNKDEYYEGWFPETEDQEVVYDSVTGVQLELDKVLKARREELDWVHKAQVYTKVPLEECYNETGKEPITLKWVDRNKGNQVKENYAVDLLFEKSRSNMVHCPCTKARAPGLLLRREATL